MNTKNYLVPMWRLKKGKMENHLALTKAENQYQAMLIAMGSHNYTEDNNKSKKDDLKNTNWQVDMNYEAYQECANPEKLFSYMNRTKEPYQNKTGSV